MDDAARIGMSINISNSIRTGVSIGHVTCSGTEHAVRRRLCTASSQDWIGCCKGEKSRSPALVAGGLTTCPIVLANSGPLGPAYPARRIPVLGATWAWLETLTHRWGRHLTQTRHPDRPQQGPSNTTPENKSSCAKFALRWCRQRRTCLPAI